MERSPYDKYGEIPYFLQVGHLGSDIQNEAMSFNPYLPMIRYIGSKIGQISNLYQKRVSRVTGQVNILLELPFPVASIVHNLQGP